jgi:hypothetical protein
MENTENLLTLPGLATAAVLPAPAGIAPEAKHPAARPLNLGVAAAKKRLGP